MNVGDQNIRGEAMVSKWGCFFDTTPFSFFLLLL